ncbi:MAG TPA: tetratricopeptide repeat protein [Bryobacteraceae bacterium]|jgi:tetratricopeptide (TPR) repeat protein|nr:tetratricopeptide repeat protein [Bryobacteraceae bacterium]
MVSTLTITQLAILESMRILALILAAGAACAQSSTPEQLFRDAVAAQQHGDDALAVRKYQELLKRYPDAVEVRANLGAALAKLARYDEAIAQYRAVLARKDNPDLRLNLALAYYKKGALSEAVQQLKTLQGDTRVATLLADCYTRLGQDEQAIAVLTPVEAAHPDDLAVAWLLGSALIRAGHQRDGLGRVDRVARQGNRPEAYLLAGQTALKMNEFERARDYADAALRLNPRLPGGDTLRGTVLTYLGDTQGAIAALRKAVEADPGDFDAQVGLGAVLHNDRDLDGARQHLQRALQLKPDSTLARYEWARLERTEGHVDAAVRDFEKVVHDDPNWAQPHVELAALYFRLNRQEDGDRERATFDRLTAAQQK